MHAQEKKGKSFATLAAFAVRDPGTAACRGAEVDAVCEELCNNC
jgi:hypothetical protein